MRVLFFTIGNRLHASSRIRAYQYISHLQDKGVKCCFLPNVSETYYRARRLSLNYKLRNSPVVLGWGRLERLLRLLWFVLLSPWYDVIFIQKFLLPVPLQRLLSALHKSIVFDFDDAIYSTIQQPFTSVQVTQSRFEHMLKLSQAVVVPNEHLAKIAYSFNSNVIRIPGPIDTERYRPLPKKDCGEIIVGWIGSPSTTEYLESLFDVLRKLTVNYPQLVVRVIGASSFSVKGINLQVEQWNWDTEVNDLAHFDIGIMPLPDNEWTRSKGGYKLLQYMAMQIPCVASPVGINTEIIRDGVNGFLARSQVDWYNKLSILIEDTELRMRMGKEGREIAEREYSLKAAVPKLINILHVL